MEHRATIFGLGDQQRGDPLRLARAGALALIATSRLWNEGGLGVLIWLGLIGLAAWGMFRVWKTYSEY